MQLQNCQLGEIRAAEGYSCACIPALTQLGCYWQIQGRGAGAAHAVGQGMRELVGGLAGFVTNPHREEAAFNSMEEQGAADLPDS